ncbi:hypothetical protein [Pseudoalteromonas peptidolytica]|uniref:hypothetical protein n=1 Tax=Pseudoalteromonas peptidolytica TaxID=61150 RepID=UPI001CE42D35|nr:hypothetical protein [Pseudoalteromonas peptidolytica]
MAITEYHQQAVDLSSPINHEWCTYYLNSGPALGAKYGRGSQHDKIINAGWAQKDFDPEYTITAQYREGEWDEVNGRLVKIKAKFRCDTFVNYSFKKVTGSNLVTVFTPRNLYNSFPSSR